MSERGNVRPYTVFVFVSSSPPPSSASVVPHVVSHHRSAASPPTKPLDLDGAVDEIEETPPSAPPKKRLKARKLSAAAAAAATAAGTEAEQENDDDSATLTDTEVPPLVGLVAEVLQQRRPRELFETTVLARQEPAFASPEAMLARATPAETVANAAAAAAAGVGATAAATRADATGRGAAQEEESGAPSPVVTAAGIRPSSSPIVGAVPRREISGSTLQGTTRGAATPARGLCLRSSLGGGNATEVFARAGGTFSGGSGSSVSKEIQKTENKEGEGGCREEEGEDAGSGEAVEGEGEGKSEDEKREEGQRRDQRRETTKSQPTHEGEGLMAAPGEGSGASGPPSAASFDASVRSARSRGVGTVQVPSGEAGKTMVSSSSGVDDVSRRERAAKLAALGRWNAVSLERHGITPEILMVSRPRKFVCSVPLRWLCVLRVFFCFCGKLAALFRFYF